MARIDICGLGPSKMEPLTDEELLQVTTECGKTAEPQALLIRLAGEVRQLRQAVRDRQKLIDRAVGAFRRTLR